MIPLLEIITKTIRKWQIQKNPSTWIIKWRIKKSYLSYSKEKGTQLIQQKEHLRNLSINGSKKNEDSKRQENIAE